MTAADIGGIKHYTQVIQESRQRPDAVTDIFILLRTYTAFSVWMTLQEFLNNPPWSSDRDHQRRFLRLQTFRPFESPDVFGGRAASGDQPDVPVGFLSFGTQRLPPAMRGSLWPSYAGHCCLDWSDFRKL